MCKFLYANLIIAMFSNSILGRLHYWAYLFTNNLEVVSHCNSGCSIIMVESVYSVKLGLVPLKYAAIRQYLLAFLTMADVYCLIAYNATSVAAVGNEKLLTLLRCHTGIILQFTFLI